LRIEVVSLKDEVFFGNLVVEANGHVLNIDSRPSDALALAVRAHVPILVSREVLDSAGVQPEDDMRSQKPPSAAPLAPPSRPATPAEPEGSGSEERLSVFEDFLDNLNLDNLDPPADEDEDDANSKK
jgi:bifunctional DNase/RNase